MAKLGDRNTIRLNGSQFNRAIRYTRKMKRASLAFLVEVESEKDETQVILEIKNEQSIYRRNIYCQLLRIHPDAIQVDRRLRERQSAVKHNAEEGEIKVKQLHLPDELPARHPVKVNEQDRNEETDMIELMDRLIRQKEMEKLKRE